MTHEFEEEFFHDRKEFKRKRKQKQDRDRSKFKKTDQKQKAAEPFPSSDLIRGRVLSILGETIIVSTIGGEEYQLSLRGALKKEKSEIKNIIAVGDFVLFSKESLAIEKIEERFSLLSRTDMVRKKQQIIAVNVDQALICISVVEPPLKPALVDRTIIAARKGNMDALIVITKIDLLKTAAKEENQLYEEFVRSFSSLGYSLFPVSSLTGEGIDNLLLVMKDKTSVFFGQSGTGKTSLINFIEKKNFKTLSLTRKTKKGSHATTKAQLIPLTQGGYCVDTPGVRSFGIWKLEKEDIRAHFFEMIPFSKKCRFPDCSHRNEPECMVKKAVESGKISRLRFDSYLSLMDSIEHPMEERS